MAHELEIIDGKAQMFYVGDTPWHELGTPLKDPPTIEEAIRLAGLNWTVETRPLFLEDGRKVPNQATVRTSDGKVLGVVGPGYKPLQNEIAFGFFQPFIDSKQASLNTAGSLYGGTRVWILADVNGVSADVVPGDAVKQHILLANSHDGTLAVTAGFTRIRVVCSNTLAAAVSDRASKLIKIKHTKNVNDALVLVRQAMVVASAEFQATVEAYRQLARKGCNTADLEKYVKLVFAPKKSVKLQLVGDGEKASDAVKAALEEARKEQEEDTTGKRVLPHIIKLFESGKGSDLPGVRGTYWAAYNAATEYLSYVRGKSDDRRLDNLWFGDAANLNKRALDVALAA